MGGRVRNSSLPLHLRASNDASSKTITSHLAHGTTVLIDRYYYSGIAYTSAKLNPSLSPHWAKQPDVGLPRPDICLFLYLEPQDAESRAGFGDERYEKAEFQARVREAFQPLLNSKEVVRIDAKGTMDEVGNRIWTETMKRFREVDEEDRPIDLME
jgi:dTMP kinase